MTLVYVIYDVSVSFFLAHPVYENKAYFILVKNLHFIDFLSYSCKCSSLYIENEQKVIHIDNLISLRFNYIFCHNIG